MADGDPIRIGRDTASGGNIASNPGAETLLIRPVASGDPVFTVRTPVAGDCIHGEAGGNGTGVYGESNTGSSVQGLSITSGTGVSGGSQSGRGVNGDSSSGPGVNGTSSSGPGVLGTSSSGPGVLGNNLGAGVPPATSTSDFGVVGASGRGGVKGVGLVGVQGDTPVAGGIGVFGRSTIAGGFAGIFDGDLAVVNGDKPFTIDHPLDPENKYLVHASVESSERKNVYDGIARLDEDGATWVELPEWFEALNGDFRYQLTPVGGSAPGLHVAEEVSENRFKIAGGEEGMKVCWQLTGTRKDPWAAEHPFVVELEKPEEERGRYLDPSLYDAPEEQRVMIGPIAEAQRPPEPSDIDFARLEEEHRRQLYELRRLEEEHRREMEELLRRMEERQGEAPPEST